MKLCFDSIAEVREFVAALKGTRGKKGEGDDDGGNTAANAAPAPLMPPQGQPGSPGPGASAAFTPPQQAGFPGAPSIDPAVAGLVQRIATRIDGAIQSGQPADTVLTWFRGQCGNEAANATMDQIKQIFLPKLTVPTLENIAKLMNA